MSVEVTVFDETMKAIKSLPKDELRSFITTVCDKLLTYPQVEIPTDHTFSDGVYARSIHIPKGSIIAGRVHKYRNLNILSGGDLTLVSQDCVERFQGHCAIVAEPGAQRLFFAHEDCVWTTVLATGMTNPQEIESFFTVDSYSEFLLGDRPIAKLED